MEQNRILTRDLKQILAAAVAMTKDPGTAERLLALAERAENATERFMAEQHELRCMKDEHKQFLARAAREHDERIRCERDAWDREEAQRRKRLERTKTRPRGGGSGPTRIGKRRRHYAGDSLRRTKACLRR
jgi:hypothetical protein